LLAEICKKLADDFKCSEEDVVSIFDTLNDDYEHLIKTQYAYEKTNQLATLSFPEDAIVNTKVIHMTKLKLIHPTT